MLEDRIKKADQISSRKGGKPSYLSKYFISEDKKILIDNILQIKATLSWSDSTPKIYKEE
jgi:hypothetical protein